MITLNSAIIHVFMSSLSVIIPCYNKIEYLDQCVMSVLEQTYDNLEVIIVDDCSTDDSYLLAQKYANTYHNVKAYQNTSNSGVSMTRNNGVLYAKSKYITFLDADDYYYDTKKIERELRIMNDYGDDMIAYSNIVFVDPQGTQIKIMKLPKNVSGRKSRLKNVIGIKHFPCRDYIFSKEIFLKVGGYNIDCCLYEDLDLLFRISFFCDFKNTNSNGTAYRQLGNGLSAKSLQVSREAQDLIVNKYIKKPDFGNPLLYWYLRVGIRRIKDLIKWLILNGLST